VILNLMFIFVSFVSLSTHLSFYALLEQEGIFPEHVV
jgi:hypothetical protein